MNGLFFSSLALLSSALLAVSPAFSPLDALAFLPALCSRLLPQRKWSAMLRLLWLSGAVGGAGWGYGWLSGHTIYFALTLALILKWAEARRPGEFLFLSPALVVAGASGLPNWGEWGALSLACLFLCLSLWVLEEASRARLKLAEEFSSGSARARRVRRTLGRQTKRAVAALPLAAALFFFFPRIPGPLLDIGLTLGLPLPMGAERSRQGLGVATRLKPGQGTARRGGDNEPVLVAEFENWVPPTALLYWRGPVYYDFDGNQWSLDAEYEGNQGRALMRRGWTKGAAFAATLAKKEHEIAYSVRLTAHDRLWLYGLDMPTALTAESFISADWQVLAHRPVKEETSYRLKSALDWEAGGALEDGLRRRALSLPKEGNPRLRAFGKNLSVMPPEERPRAALAALSQGGYKVRERFALDETDSLDSFWFDQREGNADLYAGAFVFLMRAAGVPARLAAGFRGGKLMALTEYVIVKKEHAYAWAEIWQESKGWRRIDPADIVAPERFADGQTAKTAAPKQNIDALRAESGTEAKSRANAPVRTKTASRATNNFMPRLPDMKDFFSRWVFRLDGKTQQNFLNEWGGKSSGRALNGKLAWVWLLAATAFSAVCAALFCGALERFRAYRRIPAPERIWQKTLRLLARRGFARESWECPLHFSRRVGAAKPIFAESLSALALAYSQWRYAKAQEDAPGRVKAAAGKLYNLVMADTDFPRGGSKKTMQPKP
ncbi:MAG: DUF3488 and transglutaminase-like domain-containing protein [Zoogloeaceae bacterium]|jgi:transglutaminase-like putative cysteine protease|nr:DUF3488 and transglutaminase-like domain-containing protein [Zoogloeaceae bacterium]